MNRYIQTLLLFAGLLSIFSVHAEHSNDRMIAGWLESIILAPWQIKLRAKLDTGAKTSSIHAENIERFERDGQTWLRFDLPKGRHKKTARQTIEVPLLRDVQIKRHKLPSVTRSVVEMSFCINAHYYTTQFTLADRGNYNYPVLLGRRFLKNNILVDSAKIFIHSSKQAKDSCRTLQSQASDKPLTDTP